ncbi:DUF2975 domain-containing protein [Microbacterium sp. KSW-18]|uniref:DUF2975 domain-containing protein n=1 Tax=Microbacterium aquilitoris TaxID=3067307 RepID=A0ABU3GF62_9MICO|nr:DUF2975 domain-containing protein [Microbacterium sp. KSW-18]MDT3329331.1 DUF2975 domain-containing protein [Microbacterium sp. KSW-18]
MIALAKAGASFVFTVIVVLQVWVVPGILDVVVGWVPELAGLRDAGVVLTGILSLCVLAALVCLWRLLTCADHGRLFEDGAIRWVDALIGCVAAAMIVVVVGCGVAFGAGAGSRAVLLMTGLAMVAGLGVALILGGLREVLRQAVLLQDQVAAGAHA